MSENPLQVLRDTIRDIKPVTIKELARFREDLWGMSIMTWSGNGNISPVFRLKTRCMPESLFIGLKAPHRFLTISPHQIKVIAFAYLRENDDSERSL